VSVAELCVPVETSPPAESVVVVLSVVELVDVDVLSVVELVVSSVVVSSVVVSSVASPGATEPLSSALNSGGQISLEFGSLDRSRAVASPGRVATRLSARREVKQVYVNRPRRVGLSPSWVRKPALKLWLNQLR